MKAISSKGVENDFHIDLDEVLKMEAEDPKFSVIDLVSNISDSVRLTDIIRVARIIGWDYAEFVQAGYNLKDLMEILMGCFEELGFTSAQAVSTI